MLREIFTSLPTGDDQWRRAGYLLADRLRFLDRTTEAEALEAHLGGA